MNKFIIFLYLALVYITTATFGKPIEEHNAAPIFKIRGGIRPLLDAGLRDAEEALQLSLNKLAADDDFKLKLVKIHSASKQVVSGSKYKIKADFLDVDEKTKTCDVTIWSQPWLENGIELSEEEANETLKYVISKYEEVEMKIIGEPVSIYGLRVTYGDAEEELNIHFKYIDNTQYDIIQNCVFVLQHRQNECELIKTICNTFLPITPRPLLQRKDLRICDDGGDVQLVEKEDVDDDDKETIAATTTMTITDAEQVRSANNSEDNDDEDDDEDKEEVGSDVKEKQ